MAQAKPRRLVLAERFKNMEPANMRRLVAASGLAAEPLGMHLPADHGRRSDRTLADVLAERGRAMSEPYDTGRNPLNARVRPPALRRAHRRHDEGRAARRRARGAQGVRPGSRGPGMTLQDIDAAFEIPIDVVERANHRKLTDDDVRAIRASFRSDNALARELPRRAQGRADGATRGIARRGVRNTGWTRLQQST